MKWKRPVFALVTLGLFVGVVEGALWIAGVQTLLSERDPFQGFSEKARVFELDEQQGVYRTRPRAQKHSFNYQQFLADKPRDGFRLFSIGGSSTFGFPWGAKSAFTRVLGDALRQSLPGTTVEAINAGAMSYGSHRLRVLTHELLQYSPDLLIVYGGHNEFVERQFYAEMLDRPRELDVFRVLLYRSRLFSALTRLYESSRETTRDEDVQGKSTGELLGLDPVDVVREFETDADSTERAGVTRQLRENLEAIVDLAETAGVPIIICTVPSNHSGWVPNFSAFDADTALDARSAALELLVEGRSRLESGDFGAAIESLDRARALTPGHAEISYRLGQAHEGAGHWAEAREAYALAVDTDARPSRAIRSFNETIRDLARDRGVMLVDVEKLFRESVDHGLMGFNLFEDYVHPKPDAHRQIARELWTRLGAPDAPGGGFDTARLPEILAPGAAVTDAPLAAASASTFDQLYNLAVVLENQGLDEEAIVKYRACLVLNPRQFVARANLARLLYRKGSFAEAAAEHRQNLELDPSFVRSWIGAGDAFRGMQRNEDAQRAYERATQLDPESAAAWSGLGAALARLGKQQLSEAAFRRAAALAPEDLDARANIGFALLYQGKIDEADSEFRHCLSRQPSHLRARNGHAAVLTEQGRLGEAQRIFEENLRANPADEFAKGGLALLERRRGATR